MATANQGAVTGGTPEQPRFGVKLYAVATTIGALALISPAWGVSTTLGLTAVAFAVVHLFSVYGLWYGYLIGVDLAIGLNLVSIVGAVLVGSFVGMVLPVGFILYLQHVRPDYT